MEDGNQIEIKFISLSEQFLYSVKIRDPAFVHFGGAKVSEKSQKQMHEYKINDM